MHDQIKGVFLNRKLDFNRNTHKNTFNDLFFFHVLILHKFKICNLKWFIVHISYCIIKGCNPPCGPGLRCKNEICVPHCTRHDQCGGGKQCQDGMCVPTGGCNPPCSPGTKCNHNNQVCVPHCTRNDQCGGGKQCQDGMCVPIEGCIPPCGNGRICREGICIFACSDHTQCGPGFRCEDQICVPNPTNNQCFEITLQTVASGTWTCRSMKRTNVDDPLSERICVIWELECSDERRMDCMLACAPGQGGPWFYQVKCNF